MQELLRYKLLDVQKTKSKEKTGDDLKKEEIKDMPSRLE